MANTTNGTYGTRRPANITSDDCDIYYYYTKDRVTNSSGNFQKLESSYLENFGYDLETTNDNGDTTTTTTALPGMYNLKLPLSKFSNTGIYTIYIKPKETTTTIFDIGTLESYSDITGIVIQADSEENSMYANGNLIGYRIEFFDNNGDRLDYYRIITSNNYCEPVAQNSIDSTQVGIKYRYTTGASNLIFCTVTPNTSLSFKTNSTPKNGESGQKIALINTKFNPVTMEVEIVEHDIETVSTMLEGKQIRNLDNATITTFNSDNEIYHQAIYGQAVDANNEIHHDYKVINNDNIDFDEKDRLTDIETLLNNQ